MDILLFKWLELNEFVKDNPIVYIILFILVFVSVRLIPHIYRWRKGINLRDAAERENTRKRIISIYENVQKNSDIIVELNEAVKYQNGNIARLNREFMEHYMDGTIHIPKDKFEATHNELMKAIAGVHGRIDVILNERAR